MIAACLKWVDRRPEIDPLTGAVHDDARTWGASDADQAALEWALRHGDALGEPVLAITAGSPDADAVLRDALAAGAREALRVDLATETPSEDVAAALAPHLDSCRAVWCGDMSFDRGSGAVPAYLAAHLGVAQAVGLVSVSLGEDGTVTALRRLDGGRREVLRLTLPFVASVEGSVARLRRASLNGTLRARDTTIVVHPGPAVAPRRAPVTRPYRPRPRALAPPAGATALERITALTAAPTSAPHSPPVALSPAEAADRILEALRTWGYTDR